MEVIVQATQPAAQFLSHFGVQRPERLVQQQHLRLHRKRTGQGDALALSTRQLRGIPVGQPVELHQAQQLVHLGLDLRVGRALVARFHPQAECDVLKYGHVPEQRVMLKHEAHLTLAHIDLGRVLAAEQDVSRVGRL